MSLKLKDTSQDGATVLAVSGRLDAEAVATFDAGLTPLIGDSGSSPTRLVLDLSDLDYVSSAGLHALFSAARRVRANGGALVVAAPARFVSEVFAISRFDRVIEVFPTVNDAVSGTAESTTDTPAP
jgi:anti-anti-sigma factor